MESNKLIAEFIGWTSCDSNDSTMYANPQDKSDAWSTDEMRFNESWNWLMPVVSKITRDEKYIDNDYREHLLDIVPYGHIEDTYDAVVEFIKTHNDEEQ